MDLTNLKKIIFFKLNSDLFDKIIKPHAGEFWLIDPIENKWFLMYSNQGQLSYNQIFFNNFFKLFSLEYKQYQPILKEWFEYNFDLTISDMQRRNTNGEYFVVSILNNEKPWSIKERNGFGYYFVKKYLDLKKNVDSAEVLIENYIKGRIQI